MEQAFDLFTLGVGEWWPESHRPGKDPAGELFLLESGRFYERTSDGREFELGRVVEWVRPARLELDFYLGTGPAAPTAVTVTFTAAGDGTTVWVSHRPKLESLEMWEGRVVIYQRSWESVLGHLTNLLS